MNHLRFIIARKRLVNVNNLRPPGLQRIKNDYVIRTFFLYFILQLWSLDVFGSFWHDLDLFVKAMLSRCAP